MFTVACFVLQLVCIKPMAMYMNTKNYSSTLRSMGKTLSVIQHRYTLLNAMKLTYIIQTYKS